MAQGASTGWSAPVDVSVPSTEGLDLYGVLICDPYQNLHVLWGKSHDDESEIYYRTDVGGSLSPPQDVLALPGPLAIRLSAVISEPGDTLHVVWQTEYIRGDVVYSHVPLCEADDPRAWEPPSVLVAGADRGQLYVDAAGSVHLIYTLSDTSGYAAFTYDMRSDDDGLVWSEPMLVHGTSREVPITLSAYAAADGTGRIYAAITAASVEYGGYSELGYVISSDGGRSWERYVSVAEQGSNRFMVAGLTPFTFGEHEVHLTWHDPRRMHVWSSDGGATWSDPEEIIQLGAAFGGSNYLAKDSAGTLYAVTAVADNVYVSTYAGSRWLAPERIESRKMDPHGQQLVVCQGNQAHVVYDDRVVEDTTVWYAYRQVNAPHINQSPIPTLVGTPDARPVVPGSGATAPTAAPIGTVEGPTPALGAGPSVRSGRALMPLITPTALVCVLTFVVLAWRNRWRR